MYNDLTIVLVVDIFDAEKEGDINLRPDLEKTDLVTLNILNKTIKSLGYQLIIYDDIKELADNASKHLSDLVLTIYGGENSRNRMALVPSICETYNIPYIGLDTYGRIICQDKEISKNIAKSVGLNTPKHILIRTEKDLNLLLDTPTPFVIKPNLEGSSIGISQKNLIEDSRDAYDIASYLLKKFQQPLLAEEFIGGKEVSFNFIESSDSIKWSLSEVYINSNPNYFDNHLFDAEEKLNRYLDREVLTISDELSDTDKTALLDMISAVGEIGYGRIDGKLLNGTFYFIEITPDAWINPLGSFAKGFTNTGLAYKEVIKMILESSSRSLHNR